MRNMALAALVAGTLAISMLGATAQPQGELTVVVPNFGRETLDLGRTSTQDLQYTGHTNEPLIGTSVEGELVPDRGLSESWTISDDAKVLTLRLRKDVSWHDGKPFTADDVVFSLAERYVAKDAICTFCRLLQTAAEVVAIDPHTVRITLKEADPTFLAVLSARDGDIRILPRHAYRATAGEGLSSSATRSAPGRGSSSPSPAASTCGSKRMRTTGTRRGCRSSRPCASCLALSRAPGCRWSARTKPTWRSSIRAR